MSDIHEKSSIARIYESVNVDDLELPELDTDDAHIARNAIHTERVSQVLDVARTVYSAKLLERQEEATRLRRELDVVLSEIALAKAVFKHDSEPLVKADYRNMPSAILEVGKFSLDEGGNEDEKNDFLEVSSAIANQHIKLSGLGPKIFVDILLSGKLPREHFSLDDIGILFHGTIEEPDFKDISHRLNMKNVGPGKVAQIFDFFAVLGQRQKDEKTTTDSSASDASRNDDQ